MMKRLRSRTVAKEEEVSPPTTRTAKRAKLAAEQQASQENEETLGLSVDNEGRRRSARITGTPGKSANGTEHSIASDMTSMDSKGTMNEENPGQPQERRSFRAPTTPVRRGSRVESRQNYESTKVPVNGMAPGGTLLSIPKGNIPTPATTIAADLDNPPLQSNGKKASAYVRFPFDMWPESLVDNNVALQLPQHSLLGGRYLLRRHLGSGSFGVVMEAFDTRRRLNVAIKFCASKGEAILPSAWSEYLHACNLHNYEKTQTPNPAVFPRPRCLLVLSYNDYGTFRIPVNHTVSNTMDRGVYIKLPNYGVSLVESRRILMDVSASLRTPTSGVKEAATPRGYNVPMQPQCTPVRVTISCFVMELLSSSMDCLMNDTPPPLEVLTSVARQLLFGLKTLRAQDLVHADLKPSNVLLAQPPPRNWNNPSVPIDLKMVDFGLSVDSGAMNGAYVQTRPYRAPEIILGGPLTFAADTWSVGVIMLELIIGRRLFQGSDSSSVMDAIVELVGMPPKSYLDRLPYGIVACYFVGHSSIGFTHLPLPPDWVPKKGTGSRRHYISYVHRVTKATSLVRPKWTEAEMAKNPDSLNAPGFHRAVSSSHPGHTYWVSTTTHLSQWSRPQRRSIHALVWAAFTSMSRSGRSTRFTTALITKISLLIDLIVQLLQFEPDKRINPNTALRHEFFYAVYHNDGVPLT